MRFIFFIILSFFYIQTNGQLILNQPREDSSVGNILFSGHEHFFAVGSNIKIQEVRASVGSVSKVNDSSFKYFMPVFVAKGKMKFTVTYLENHIKKTDSIIFKFVPKSRYSCKIIGAIGNKISDFYFRNNNIQFEVFYDNLKTNADVKCAHVVYAPKRGEVVFYYVSLFNETCISNNNERYGESITMDEFKPRIGDRIFIEHLVTQMNNQEKQIEIPTYSLLLIE